LTIDEGAADAGLQLADATLKLGAALARAALLLGLKVGPPVELSLA